MDTKTFYKSEIEQIKHEELEERKVNIRAILPSEKVGKIVGRGDGAVLKGLKTLFPNVELTVDRVSSRGGCLVHTFGQAFELEELWKRIITTMYLNINDRDKTCILEYTAFHIDFIFPNDFVELLNALDAWKSMAKLSETKIIIKSSLMFNSTERLVRVSHFNMKKNTLQKYVMFISLVAKLINENLALALSAPGNIFYVTPSSDRPTIDTSGNNTSAGYYWSPYTEKDIIYNFTGGGF